MRCPKCHYLGFDSGERCRNCGYDFSLAADSLEAAELPIRVAEPLGPAADLALVPGDRAAPGRGSSARRYADFDLNLPPRSVPVTPELPLFIDDRSTTAGVAPPPAARPPLSVRRGTPEVVRLRARPVKRSTPGTPGLDLDPGPDPQPDPDRAPAAPPAEPAVPAAAEESAPGLRAAASLNRIAAGLIDLTLLAAIDVTVVYLTLRLCELTYAELWVLPWAPLAGFLALLNGGYFAAFTVAGGQTIGKMACRIRVVASVGPLHGGQVMIRTAAYLASALPAGLGFAAALVGAERRALHDRLAGTRVVKVISS